MTKAADARIKRALERERLALKANRLELEKYERKLGRERADAIVVLRLLCDRYGTNDWADETPLAEILETHLGEPLSEGIGRLQTRLSRLQAAVEHVAQPPPEQQRPAPLQLVPSPTRSVGSGEHGIIIERAKESGSGRTGYRAACRCNWGGPILPTEATAVADGERHLTRQTTTTQAR